MGRPLFTESIVATVHSMEAAKATGEDVRRWRDSDVYPEDELWWSEKELFIEAFLDKAPSLPSAGSLGAGPAAVSTNEQQVEADEIEQASTSLMRDPVSPIQDSLQHGTMDVTIPVRFTISEAELANTTLDVKVNEYDSDDDDFELAWDSSDEIEDLIPIDILSLEPHSDASTPAPSTPIIDGHMFPISVPSSPEPIQRPTFFGPRSSIKGSGSRVHDTNLKMPMPKHSNGRSVVRSLGLVARNELVL